MYVWGQRPVEMKLVGGRVVKSQGRYRRAEECKVSIRDHHEAYIDWETYQENLRFMRDNYIRQGGDAMIPNLPRWAFRPKCFISFF